MTLLETQCTRLELLCNHLLMTVYRYHLLHMLKVLLLRGKQVYQLPGSPTTNDHAAVSLISLSNDLWLPGDASSKPKYTQGQGGGGGSGTIFLGHPAAHFARRRTPELLSQNAPLPLCVRIQPPAFVIRFVLNLHTPAALQYILLVIAINNPIRKRQRIYKWEATEDTTFAHGWKRGRIKYAENLAAKNIAKTTGIR